VEPSILREEDPPKSGARSRSPVLSRRCEPERARDAWRRLLLLLLLLPRALSGWRTALMAQPDTHAEVEELQQNK